MNDETLAISNMKITASPQAAKAVDWAGPLLCELMEFMEDIRILLYILPEA